jgi:hypothetical protein
MFNINDEDQKPFLFEARSIKSLIMNMVCFKHAKENGATDEWIESIKNDDPYSIYHVVTILYGDPFEKFRR